MSNSAAGSSQGLLRVDRADGVAVVTLDRPHAKNALSAALRLRFREAMAALAQDAGVQVVVLTGAGDVFCAGLDLQELGAPGADLQAVLAEPSVVDALLAFPGPVIGAINGPAVTGGFELALGCDLMIASDRARFADTHGRVGLLPIWGLSQRLSRAVGVARAKEMSLGGNFIDARTACDWGLVNRVVPHDTLLAQACALARDMATLAPGMLVAYKRLIDDGFAQTLGQALQTEQEQAGEVNRHQTAEAIEAARQAVMRRGREQKAAAARTVLSDEAGAAPREHDGSGPQNHHNGDNKP